MFKLESYITPILLSYVNRYINNFKPEDFQVSLWGGDACFNNLELNLQVLEQELQLPFSFVSGSIRELLIHVPWTKLASEPITITINTIECILNLKGKETRGRPEAAASGREKKVGHHGKEMEPPQGYVQLLINKIVSNIRIYCNNLILKVVEEDIVLSMNVKHLKFESANKKWEPAYIDVSPAEVNLRKVITINDLTLCLDKRNASGKIEVYQDPMLYKCSMTMHLLKKYHSATANIASTTRLDIYCNNMEFSMTEQQIPMFMGLLMLLYAQKQLKPELDGAADGTVQDSRDAQDNSLGWTGWAWSYVSSVLPAPWDEHWDDKFLQDHKGHTLHFGTYIDNLSITFKVSETTAERTSYYNHKKLRYTPMLCLQLQGIYSEIVIHGLKWFNAMGGVSQAILLPLGLCSCSHTEILDESVQINYLKIGSETNGHKTDSLFDAEAVENKGKKRQYNTSWDVHMTVYSESVLLERTPAFAFDYLYQMDMPSDTSSDVLSEMGSDFEFSNFMENSSMRICLGPFKLRLCSGFFHRLSTLQVAASYYEFPPSAVQKPDKTLQELHPPSEEDFDALNEFIPSRSVRITFFAPIIELELMDHPYFQPTKGMLYRKKKKISAAPASSKPLPLPKLTVECQFFDISLNYPMYVNRLVHTTCQLPDPPLQLFDACYSRNNIKIVGLCSRLIINSNKQTTILTPSSLSYSTKSINKPQYWTNPDIAHEETTFESESITLNGTNAKMMVVMYIIGKMVKMDSEGAVGVMNNTSILSDASKDHGLPFMELCIESIRFKKVETNSTVSIDASLGSIRGFIFEPVHKKTDDISHANDIQQVLFISGPEPKTESVEEDTTKKLIAELPPLFTATVQYPVNPDNQKHPPILLFNLQEIRVCVDPLLCRWLLYTPKQFGHKLKTLDSMMKNKNISEASGSIAEIPRKTSNLIESVHSSSDREPVFIPHKVEVSKEEPVDVQEKIYNVLKKWFDVWKGMFLYGDISQCTIYFPLVSLSAIGSQGIQEAVDSAVNKDRPPDIMVITLPFANIRSAHRQSIKKYLTTLPISLPDAIWSPEKSSFPWTMSISDMSCYTIQFGNKLIFLKPVSLSATVGLSTRSAKVESDTADTTKCDIGYLGVCVHIDMSPIVISTSEVQVYLFASVLYGLMEVASNLMPEKKMNSPIKTPEVLPVVASKHSSTISPTVVRETTLDSVSDKTPPIAQLSQQDKVDESVKLTAWVQWTVTRFTIELLSNENRSLTDDLESLQPRLKLVVDAEDIVSSLDFQNVYLKIKSKIGSVSIQHYKRLTPNSKWQPGPFSGIVMRLREDIGTNQRHEDNGFVNVTITRASCQHTHTLWGAVQKRYHHKEPKRTDLLNPQLVSQSRYITEIVVNVQPIDFIISLKTLRSFYLVVVPLLEIPLSKEPTILDESTSILNANNQNIPLAYLECQDIRIVVPSVELQGTGALHDVVIFQVQKICMSPSAVNPICRAPLRPDIYEQAAHARILNVPGSEVEDRQYQLDLIGISISTGVWEDIDLVFSSSNFSSSLKSLSENPAVEWNNIDQGQPNFSQPILNVWHLTEKFDISLILAPAMVYKETTVISGHSLEINFVSDIVINLSLQQIRLLSALLSEFIALMEPLIVDENFVRPKLILPYSRSRDTTFFDEEVETCELFRDSGIETSDIKSVLSSRVLKTLSETERYVVPKSTTSLPAYSIPFDVLFTAGKISLALYQVNLPASGSVKAKRKRKKSQKVNIDEAGYEAEEEGIFNKETNYNQYIPLVYISVNQPNIFLNNKQMIQMIQITCFDLNLKLSGPEYLPINHVPREDDYPVNLLETRSGTPDSSTGIFPAFFTGKFSKGISKNATVDIEISKPTKLLCSTSKWGYLLNVKDKVIDAFRGNKKDLVVVSESVEKQFSSADISMSLPTTSNKIKSSDSYGRFQEIKDSLGGINPINVKFNQLIFSVNSDAGHEVHLGVEKISSNISLLTRPEKLSIKTNLQCITLSVINDVYKKLLLNPWTVSLDVSIFWESWQTHDSDPQIRISVESDCILVDVSPEQLKCLEVVVKEVNEFLSTMPFTENEEEVGLETLPGKGFEKDQHYKDDLRAGAFQFIDAVSEKTEELPLPYQVMFWNKPISAMAWRYPQPRALTKVRVFPVPYKMTLASEDDSQVLCHLEYWSECRNSYLPFTQFYLSESEVCHLTLPGGNPQPIVASTWRVVITMVNNNEDQSNNVLISPRALAACMRIDSYFNKSLIPNITAAMYITKIDLSLYNYFDRYKPTNVPNYLSNFTPDYMFPENQRFLTLTFYNITGYLLNWELDSMSIELSTAVKCNVVDYSFLTDQSFIEPFTCKIEATVADEVKCDFISKPIQLKFGPNVAHCLAVAAQVWDQNYTITDKEKDFLIMTKIVICNDTIGSIRFGQAGTDEDILLLSRQFHLYSWRSQKKKQKLRIALEENEWVWSRYFTIFEDGTEVIKFNTDRNVSLFVSIQSLSATQKKITIFGQLIVSNMLLEHFDMKVVEAVRENRDIEFKNTPTILVPSHNSTPSIFINRKKKYYLRLRFFGLDSAWTGDIPLIEHHTGSQPWLVKVPLQERGQFLSIWCRIVTQEINSQKRILAVLWPLFTVKSNLPIDSQVHIETPTLNVHLDSSVNGRGRIQQLYCPGTIDHSHQLTFKIDNSESTSNPYIPLNYSLVDQHTFFKKPENEDIDAILLALKNFDNKSWPYFGDELDEIDWIVEDQPLTHVQVKYQNACPYSCSLLVELLPWCLTVNTLGVPISLMSNGTELCRIPHHGIVAPPKLEDNFNLGTCMGGSWHYSEPLQLAKSDWSQAFYMPKITGTIPQTGCIKTVIDCDNNICSVLISSLVANDMRLLKVSSTHILSNHMATQVQVICLAVPEGEEIYDFPENIEPYSFTLAPHLNKSNSGISIIKWHTLLNTPDIVNNEYVLYFSFCISPDLGWSCPVRVDKPFLKRSICITSSTHPLAVVLTCQEHKGQMYISLHNDTKPQLLIINKTGATLYCAQSLKENEVIEETQHFRWYCKIGSHQDQYYSMPLLSEKFPELPQFHYSERLALACEPEDGDFQWSTNFSLTHDYEQYVRVPFYGDIQIIVVNTACTTFLTLESGSEMEISASDIRVRLSMQEVEVPFNSKPLQLSKLYDPEDLPRSLSDTVIPADNERRRANATYQSRSNNEYSSSDESLKSKRRWSESNVALLSPKTKSLLVRTLPMREQWNCLKFNALIKSFSVIFISDLKVEGTERWEVASLICDNIVICAAQTEKMKLKVSASAIQFDNQLYSRESYDFPVLLIGQDTKELNKRQPLNIPIENLIQSADEEDLFILDVILETWRDKYGMNDITGVKSVKITINPISCFVEDTYVTKLLDYFSVFTPTKLILWPDKKAPLKLDGTPGSVSVPELVSWQCAIIAKPLTVRSLSIAPISLLLSIHSSIKLYIALDQSPLQFGNFERRRIVTTPYRLGHALTMHYLSGAIFGAGWVVSSLELLGSPGGLARAMGTGLRDFISLPYRGLIVGPMAFLRGITQGSASLMKHVTAGTLQSVTKLASSVARNLDRLTLDEEHVKRTEEQRRQKPQGLAQGFLQGLTGLGISLLGAIGGVAHHPLQSMMSDGASPRSLVTGVGLGLVGMVTKPLSGAAELVALTGQGLLQGAGWTSLPEPRTVPSVDRISQNVNSLLKYSWKNIQTLTPSHLLYVTEATNISNTYQYEATALILTLENLIVVNLNEDITQRVINLTDLIVCPNNDPTLLVFKLTSPLKQSPVEEDGVMEMDPVSRARVAAYVKNTVGVLHLPDTSDTVEQSNFDISPLSSPGSNSDVSMESTVLTYYVNLQSRNYFLSLLNIAKQQRQNYNFPIL